MTFSANLYISLHCLDISIGRVPPTPWERQNNMLGIAAVLVARDRGVIQALVKISLDRFGIAMFVFDLIVRLGSFTSS
jgi:hypothetical protein